VNSGIRRVGALMIVLFLALVAQLTYLQVGRSTSLANDPRNARRFLRDISRDRGPIITADGVIVALGTHAELLQTQPRYRHLMSGAAGEGGAAGESDDAAESDGTGERVAG